MTIFRANTWWNAIVPQVLGWIYFCALLDPTNVTVDRQRVLLFFLSLISISAFGYLLNDFFDLRSDEISGKKNSLYGLNPGLRIVLVLLPLIIGFVSWTLLPSRLGANILFTLQLTALVFYSSPPFRLKEKGKWGIVADAFYGHINPAFIAISTFLLGYSKSGTQGFILLGLLFLCTGLKGIRNILLHQLEDRKKDRMAGIGTFVVKRGALFSLNLVNRLLPLETFFTIALALLISVWFPPFFLSILIFAVLTYLKFSGWKLGYLPKRQLKFKFLYFLNDYYEGWMPVFFLLLLGVRQHEFLFLLALHLILFPSFLIKLWNDLKTIGQNFKTEDDY